MPTVIDVRIGVFSDMRAAYQSRRVVSSLSLLKTGWPLVQGTVRYKNFHEGVSIRRATIRLTDEGEPIKSLSLIHRNDYNPMTNGMGNHQEKYSGPRKNWNQCFD